MTDAQDQCLSLMARRRQFDSAFSLGRNFEQTNGNRISAQTVRNRLHAANLRAKRPVVRPPLTPRLRRFRHVFARYHTLFGRQRLRNVMWTDESKLNLHFNDGRRRVWKQSNERFRDCCVVEHDPFGGGQSLYGRAYPIDGCTDFFFIRNGALTVRYRD